MSRAKVARRRRRGRLFPFLGAFSGVARSLLPIVIVGAGIALVLLSGNALGAALPPGGTRDPNDIFAAVAALNPQTNPVYQPGYGGGATWCNKFLADVLLQLGIAFPGPPTLANSQVDYLRSGADGWVSVGDMFAAQSAALNGQVAVAVYKNESGGPGHSAIILPVDGPIVMTAQAGASNWNQGPLLSGFGTLPTEYFVHA